MSRSPTKQTVEPKETEKEKKKTTPRRRHPSGTWPCKINGCNKEFAREADLKRHQRTTKLHSSSSLNVICPQCHGTFTRTDALRRHQKSRHNGIILDPIVPEEADSQQQSRSGSPMMGRLKLRINLNGTSSPLAAGPLSYYRSHILPAEAFSALRPSMGAPTGPTPSQTSNSSVATHLPTSAARLHGASWPPAPPWMQEPSAGRPSSVNHTFSARPSPHYTPGTYYRSSNPEGSDNLAGEQAKQDSSQDLSSEAGISSGDIDPNLSTESPTEVHTNGAISSPEAPFHENGDLNFAVQKALQAVLADSIDPSLSVATSSESSGPGDHSQGQSRGAQLQSSTDSNANGKQETVSDADIVFKALVNGDDAMEVIPSGQDTALHLSNELLPIPTSDGSVLQPDELLNEDTLRFTTTL